MRTKLTYLILMLIGTLMALSAYGLHAAQSEDSEPVKFEFDLTDPIVTHGGLNEWDSRFTAAGAVVYDGELYHMFRNGYRGWPLPSQVGYMTSPDGVEWTDSGDQPVFLSVDVPFDQIGPTLLTSALQNDDGTWVFYFAVYNTNASRTYGIARATAPTPTGPWTMDAELSLEPGSPGTWDSNAVAISKVIRTADGYSMYYMGDQNGVTAIGLAFSEDGIHWQKYDDPSTTDPLYAESDPVFTTEADWEINVQDPRVVQTPGGLVMLYSSFNGSGRNQGYGIATSTDGIHWERYQDEPVLARSELFRNPWYPEFLYVDGTFYFYLEADAPDGGTHIFLSTYEGSFFD